MQKEEKGLKYRFLNRKFTLLDYFIHFGVLLNIIVVGLLLWLGLTSY